MNERSFDLASKIIPSYVSQARDTRKTRERLINELLDKKKWPEEGWDDQTIEIFLQELSLMDTNNFPKTCGVGEREARVYSSLVQKRNCNFAHGIGRSGDLEEIQPKAAGSSLVNKLINSLALDALRTLGVPSTKACIVTPVATGMSIMLVLLTLRQIRPQAEFVVWSRIDQKSCLKSITTAGFKVKVLELKRVGDELRTDVEGLERMLSMMEPESVACVLTTTSCFAPRSCDSVEEVAVLCKKLDLPHVVNNAYGVQSSKCMHVIQQASVKGRVDAFVQSTDKNFMVPVGGAIIAGFDKSFISKISQSYPGRASLSPSLDLFITLLSMGSCKYLKLAKERKENFELLKSGLRNVAEEFGERVLQTAGNPISVGMTLCSLQMDDPAEVTKFGSMLFTRNVSGARVVTGTETKTISNVHFQGWGAHCNDYPWPYLTAAAAVGMESSEIDIFIAKLRKTMSEWRTRKSRKREPEAENSSVGICNGTGKKVSVDMFEQTKVSATFQCVDSSLEHVLVSDLQTSIGKYPNSVLRFSDIVALTFSVSESEDLTPVQKQLLNISKKDNCEDN